MYYPKQYNNIADKDELRNNTVFLKFQENETNSEGKEEVIYKIDIPANRTDLLCVEGLGQALSVFINR